MNTGDFAIVKLYFIVIADLINVVDGNSYTLSANPTNGLTSMESARCGQAEANILFHRRLGHEIQCQFSEGVAAAVCACAWLRSPQKKKIKKSRH